MLKDGRKARDPRIDQHLVLEEEASGRDLCSGQGSRSARSGPVVKGTEIASKSPRSRPGQRRRVPPDMMMVE